MLRVGMILLACVFFCGCAQVRYSELDHYVASDKTGLTVETACRVIRDTLEDQPVTYAIRNVEVNDQFFSGQFKTSRIQPAQTPKIYYTSVVSSDLRRHSRTRVVQVDLLDRRGDVLFRFFVPDEETAHRFLDAVFYLKKLARQQ